MWNAARIVFLQAPSQVFSNADVEVLARDTFKDVNVEEFHGWHAES